MNKSDIVKAWKDVNFRNQLDASQRAALPEHPAGEIELTDAECALIGGGRPKNTDIPWACNWTTSQVSICR